MTALALIIALFVLTFVLIKVSDHVVIAVRRLSRATHISAFVLSVIILSIGTTLPELFVSTTSALNGVSSLSLGVIMGSNIANIALITGLAALTMGSIRVDGNFVKREIWMALVAGALPILLIVDGKLSRVDGLILLAIYAAYTTSFLKIKFREIVESNKRENFVHRFWRRLNHIESTRTKEYGRLFISIAILLFCADLIVKTATSLASLVGVPVFLIGIIFVAIGTSLPELAFALRAVKDKEPTMFFGNLLGSTIINSTLIIGLAAVISPIKTVIFSEYLVSGIFFVVIFLVFWYFIKSKLRLEKWEAAVLLFLYLLFVLLEFVL
ncbi:MAG: sodium:calcium antiporter [bacterium]|nr:sodium:calcium antiporter [bacterium]